MTKPRVVVVGGGASGTLLAVELLRQAIPMDVVVVESRPDLGKGFAYATESPLHLLNVRAGRMSGRADDPNHFVGFLRREQGDTTEATFAPRRVYGRYLSHLLSEARDDAARGSGSSLRHVVDRATSVESETDGAWRVGLARRRSISARVVVLALGAGAPAGFPAPIPEGVDRERFLRDPWDRTPDVPAEEDVLLIGTGLTAVDVVLSLRERGHRGRIHVVSRHGLLPRVQAAVQPSLTPAGTDAQASDTLATAALAARIFGDPTVRADLNRLTRGFRAEVRRLAAGGGDWHDVFEATRPLTAALWAGLPWAHRRRFLRHLRPYWDAHRHRMPRESADVVAGLRGSGALQLWAARVLGFVAAKGGLVATLAVRGDQTLLRLPVGRVILCTGHGPLSGWREPIVESLLSQHLVRFDPLGLGLDALPDGGLVAASGAPSRGLFALGPLLKGVRWETTAIPEIRVQAAALGRRIAEVFRLSAQPRGVTASPAAPPQW